jgi:hypothetical protein
MRLLHSINNKMSVMNVIAANFIPNHLLAVIDDLKKLRHLANAIYDLEAYDKNNIIIRELLLNCSTILKKIALCMNNISDKNSIELRSELLSYNNTELLVDIAKIPDQELSIVLGPMVTTWLDKERVKRFSYIAAVMKNNLKYYIDNHYQDEKQITNFMRSITAENELGFLPLPPCFIADLIFAGGAGDKNPRHFAHFLPEDEGKAGSIYKKTIIYANIYQHRFMNTTIPIGLKCVNNFKLKEVTTTKALKFLLLWMRGHDIGHFARLPSTNFKALREVSYFNSMALQELIADCFGYILSFPTYGYCKQLIDTESAKNIILAEMLRYMLKDNLTTPDSLAAYIELNYLIKHQFVTINNNKLTATPKSLFEGLKALTKLVITIVLKPDIIAARKFLHEYGNKQMSGNCLKQLSAKWASNFTIGEHLEYKESL